MINIAVFASGSGTNAENLIRHFQHSDRFHIVAVFCNNPNAGVLERAKNLNTKAVIFNRSDLRDSIVASELKDLKVDAIVLAGFLWKVPDALIKRYPDRIINIHPALLPAYGGKGMYGNHVHESVIKSGDKTSGITIHLVNEHYDEGRILFQKKCPVLPDDTPATLAARIHELEYSYFPEVVEDYLRQTLLKV